MGIFCERIEPDHSVILSAAKLTSSEELGILLLLEVDDSTSIAFPTDRSGRYAWGELASGLVGWLFFIYIVCIYFAETKKRLRRQPETKA